MNHNHGKGASAPNPTQGNHKMTEPTRKEIVDKILETAEMAASDCGPGFFGLDDEVYSTEDILNVIFEIRQNETE